MVPIAAARPLALPRAPRGRPDHGCLPLYPWLASRRRCRVQAGAGWLCRAARAAPFASLSRWPPSRSGWRPRGCAAPCPPQTPGLAGQDPPDAPQSWSSPGTDGRTLRGDRKNCHRKRSRSWSRRSWGCALCGRAGRGLRWRVETVDAIAHKRGLNGAIKRNYSRRWAIMCQRGRRCFGLIAA